MVLVNMFDCGMSWGFGLSKFRVYWSSTASSRAQLLLWKINHFKLKIDVFQAAHLQASPGTSRDLP